jgi:hypothetical protein
LIRREIARGEIAKSESIYLKGERTDQGLRRIAIYWGNTALGYMEQGRAQEALKAAAHAAHYGLLVIQAFDPDPAPEPNLPEAA